MEPESSVTRSIAPKRVALENRRYLPKRLLGRLAGTQEEPYGKKSSMGSENRQRCSRRCRKSALMRSVPPRFDCVGRGTR